jgi:SAM-dependent methyltransferase
MGIAGVGMRECPFCLSTEVSGRLRAREMSQGTREYFDYLVCGHCGSIHIDRVPADLAKYYEGYFSLGLAPARPTPLVRLKRAAASAGLLIDAGALHPLRPLLRRLPAWTWKAVLPNYQAFLYACPRRDARILDVGCGNGAFVDNLRRLGFRKARGIDPFIDAAALGKPHVTQGEIADVAGRFDFIVFNHSLEHLADPQAALRAAARLLARRGTVIVHIPNADSAEFTAYRDHWWGLHAPRHLALPSRDGMRLAALASGLAIADSIGTARFDNYLYSREYALDIADHDPSSWRAGGDACRWTEAELAEAEAAALAGNADGSADWLCYYLRRAP